MVSTVDFQSTSGGFDSPSVYHSGVEQLVACLSHKQKVTGSSPVSAKYTPIAQMVE